MPTGSYELEDCVRENLTLVVSKRFVPVDVGQPQVNEDCAYVLMLTLNRSVRAPVQFAKQTATMSSTSLADQAPDIDTIMSAVLPERKSWIE